MTIKRENGQAMVLTVLFLAGLIGMSALVLDVGSWFREKRQLQLTADAAALAGAQALPGSPAERDVDRVSVRARPTGAP